jgi:hypothetical protein
MEDNKQVADAEGISDSDDPEDTAEPITHVNQETVIGNGMEDNKQVADAEGISDSDKPAHTAESITHVNQETVIGNGTEDNKQEAELLAQPASDLTPAHTAHVDKKTENTDSDDEAILRANKTSGKRKNCLDSDDSDDDITSDGPNDRLERLCGYVDRFLQEKKPHCKDNVKIINGCINWRRVGFNMKYYITKEDVQVLDALADAVFPSQVKHRFKEWYETKKSNEEEDDGTESDNDCYSTPDNNEDDKNDDDSTPDNNDDEFLVKSIAKALSYIPNLRNMNATFHKNVMAYCLTTEEIREPLCKGLESHCDTYLQNVGKNNNAVCKNNNFKILVGGEFTLKTTFRDAVNNVHRNITYQNGRSEEENKETYKIIVEWFKNAMEVAQNEQTVTIVEKLESDRQKKEEEKNKETKKRKAEETQKPNKRQK